MSNTNDFDIELSFEVEQYDSVNKKIFPILKKLSESGNIDLNFKANEAGLKDIQNQFDKLSKTQIKIFEDGNYNRIQTLKNSIGEVLKLTEQFDNKGNITGSSITDLSSSTKVENQKKYIVNY